MLFIDDISSDNIYNILSSKAVHRACRKEGMCMRFTIEHLVKHFEKKEVLRDIDFTFESGKIYGLLGRNGAGKTTLFNCLNKDMKADGGNFYLEEGGRKRETVPDDIGYVLSAPTVPAFVIGAGLVTLLYLSGGTKEPVNYVMLLVSVLCMSAFFSMHYLTIYYLLQPYNAGTEIKSGTYRIVVIATYLFCYGFMQLQMSAFVFGLGTIIFCVVYCAAACVLVYRLAPRTFRLRA